VRLADGDLVRQLRLSQRADRSRARVGVRPLDLGDHAARLAQPQVRRDADGIGKISLAAVHESSTDRTFVSSASTVYGFGSNAAPTDSAVSCPVASPLQTRIFARDLSRRSASIVAFPSITGII